MDWACPAKAICDMISIMSDFFDFLRAKASAARALNAGQCLFTTGDPVESLHLVEDGCVQLVRRDEDGIGAVMQRAISGSVLAESSIFSTHYHCAAEALVDSRVLVLPISPLLDLLDRDPNIAGMLARHLAREVQAVRTRAELLTRRTVRDRLDGWLAVNGGVLPAKGNWRFVAEDIGVTPEAFYRELQRRNGLAAQAGTPNRSCSSASSTVARAKSPTLR